MTYIKPEISNHLPKITLSYINNDKGITSFYNNSFEIDNYLDQLKEKKEQYNDDYRKVLGQELFKQYKDLKNNDKQLKHIKSLSNSNTFTVCTGHQLNLFTGPLYFFYKIIDAIKICDQLQLKYPEYNFVPIYWMASEDHDFEEINFFNLNKTKFEWNINSKGPVGRLKTNDLNIVFEKLKSFFKNSNDKNLLSLFKSSYLNNKNLSESTLSLVHSLFADYGLLIIQPDNKNLKNLFKEFFLDEVLNKSCYNKVSKTNINLKNSLNFSFNPQVNPREINMFYILDNIRERIDYKNNMYHVLNTEISFTQTEIIDEINNFPERFSPNVLLRPLYQEHILPNLSYVGGGSEIAYWLQLKDYFDFQKISFPILSVRSSLMLISKKQQEKCDKLKIKIEDLFKNIDQLKVHYLKNNSKIVTDLSVQKKAVRKNFNNIYNLAKLTDKSFIGAVKAQEKKQLNGLNNLEKRLIKAEKRKHKDFLDRIEILKKDLFPNNSFQERQLNFSSFFNSNKKNFLSFLIEKIDPFNNSFNVVKY